MCDYFHWDRDSEEKNDARDRMRHAMVLQFNDTFGTNAEDLITWHNLCDVISIRPIPETLHACRQVHVVQQCGLLRNRLTSRTGSRYFKYQHMRSSRRPVQQNTAHKVPLRGCPLDVHSGYWEVLPSR